MDKYFEKGYAVYVKNANLRMPEYFHAHHDVSREPSYEWSTTSVRQIIRNFNRKRFKCDLMWILI